MRPLPGKWETAPPPPSTHVLSAHVLTITPKPNSYTI